MQAQEVMDQAVEVLEYAPALGVQVKTLIGFVAGPAVTWAGYKLLSWPFRKRPRTTKDTLEEIEARLRAEAEGDQVAEFEEKPKRSPACEVILRSLDDAGPSYNPEKCYLFCPGVAVHFVSNEGKGIIRILGNPRFEGDKLIGTEVYTLLAREEQTLVWARANEVREAAVARDQKLANERAAAEITGAHYREKMRQQAVQYNCNRDPSGNVVYAAGSFDWLKEPAAQLPAANGKR